MKYLLCILLILVWGCSGSPPVEDAATGEPQPQIGSYCKGKVSSDYDNIFVLVQHQLPKGMDYCDLKALCFIESSLQPEAISGVKAKGLCQILDDTFAETGESGSIFEPFHNARAAASYLRTSSKNWTLHNRSRDCINDIRVGIYNAGSSRMYQGQIASGGQSCVTEAWNLPEETSNHIVKFNRTKAQWGES